MSIVAVWNRLFRKALLNRPLPEKTSIVLLMLLGTFGISTAVPVPLVRCVVDEEDEAVSPCHFTLGSPPVLVRLFALLFFMC